MALNELLQFPPVVPMIPGTGVQFLDFGFSIEKQTPVPKDWGFFDPKTTLNNPQPVPCVRRGDDEPTGGVESYAVDIKGILQMFDRVWVPIPMLRREPKDFFNGPTNWVRSYLVKLDEPDADGHQYRLVLAVDTMLLPYVQGEAYLAPSLGDCANGRTFEVPAHDEQAEWFYNQGWVRDWCLHLFRQMLEREDRRRRQFSVVRLDDDEVHERMEGSNEHVARYRAYVDLLQSLDILPALQMTDRASVRAPIEVDLVLDLGNSRSCGLLIESDGERRGGADITTAVKLQLRDLSRTEQVYSEPFPSRFEFARVEFGPEHLSLAGGRPDAFVWPTAVRAGVEAARLAAQRLGTEGPSGLSSPKRYLWDDDVREDSWQFSTPSNDPGAANFAIGVPFTTHVNERGEALHRIDPTLLVNDLGRGYEAIYAYYSRRNLTAFALGEIFVQAMSMLNSPMYRLRRPANATLPRQLRRIILTMPTAMPLAERQILKHQAESARDLAYLSLGLATKEYDDQGRPTIEYPDGGKGPDVMLQWDEATATQAVYLYTQIAVNHSGDARAFFRSMRHPASQNDPDAGDHFRLATIDLGGGTTDLVVTSIDVQGSGAHVTLLPRQEFREGFNLAGDDALLRVVREHLIEPIRDKLREMGLGERAEYALNQLLGGDRGDMKAIDIVRRQQFAAQIAAPIALAMLQEYESYDTLAPVPSIRRNFGEFFVAGNQPSAELIAHFNTELAKHGARGFQLQDLELEIDLVQIDRTVRSVFHDMLQTLGELLYLYRCDVLILSGRTSRLPAVRAIIEEASALPPHRVLPLHLFRVGQWYPFRDYRATVGDPKTTAAVGAMICLLGNGQLHNFNFRSDQLRPRSTARYFGKLDQSSRLLSKDEFYDNLDLDKPDYDVPETPFEFRGPMSLGFRQLPVDRWPASKLYVLEYASAADSARINQLTPLEIVLKRDGRPTRDKLTGEAFFESPGLMIKSAKDIKGTGQMSGLKMRLQTLAHPQGYWLDTGILLGS